MIAFSAFFVSGLIAAVLLGCSLKTIDPDRRRLYFVGCCVMIGFAIAVGYPIVLGAIGFASDASAGDPSWTIQVRQSL